MARTAAAPDTWMPLWIGAYLANTLHLNRAQHGSYMLLILATWKAGGRLPDNNETLATIARCSAKEWKAERDVFAAFYEIQSGWWVHERVMTELEKAAAFKAKQSANGSQGGRPPKPKEEPNPKPKPNPQKTTSPSPEEPLQGSSSGETSFSVAARESAEGAHTHNAMQNIHEISSKKKALQ